jgi:hypothetical protein
VRLDAPIPPGAEERAHRVAMAAFASQRPAAKRRTYWRPAIALAVAAAAVGILASPPGRSVIHAIREAVGVKKAQRALFALPAPGRILVNSSRGAWVVEQNGSKRLLGPYREASWSPFGRFVVGLKGDELVTMEPNGHVHWTLARPGLQLPAWGGQHNNTRIAYLSQRSLHVVAGDSSGDAMRCADNVAPVAPVWQPLSLSVLAFAAPNGQLQVYDVTTCRLILRTPPGPPPSKLEWSSDGNLLLALSPFSLRVYDLHGHILTRDDPSDGTYDSDAAFLAEKHDVAVVRLHGAQADAFELPGGGTIFHVTGGLRQVIPSPDGRWLLLTSPAANQWIFVRLGGAHAIRAFSGIKQQFGGGKFPTVSGWVGK